jgi:HEXXH motif-containing protein
VRAELNPDTLGDALSWAGGTALAERFDADFAAECETAAGQHASAATSELISVLDAGQRDRVLRAPEITRQTLFTSTLPPEGVDSLLNRSAQIELACAEGGTGASSGWSALGDVMVQGDGTTKWWPQMSGSDAVPLDFGSPWAQRIDLSGRLEIDGSPRPSLAADAVSDIHDRLTEAMALMREASPALPRFVAICTRVVVLQIDPLSSAIASGSNGRFVGRSVISNPQSDDGTIDCLAEALVHEAIHALIYSESLRHSWTVGEASIEVARIESPWSGRTLPVRPFLEAACVWFGLVHLWTLALRHQLFARDAAHRRLMRSLRGFCRGSLVDRVRPWWPEIRPDVLATVDGLQARIRDAVGDGV